jgi:hypothetical protein
MDTLSRLGLRYREPLIVYENFVIHGHFCLLYSVCRLIGLLWVNNKVIIIAEGFN